MLTFSRMLPLLAIFFVFLAAYLVFGTDEAHPDTHGLISGLFNVCLIAVPLCLVLFSILYPLALSDAPCSEFTNFRIGQVPSRCLKYYIDVHNLGD